MSSLAVLFTVLSTRVSSTKLSQFLCATVLLACGLFSVKQFSGPLKVTGKFKLFWEGETRFCVVRCFSIDCSLQSDNPVQSELHSLNSSISLTFSYCCVYCDVFYCVYFHCMIFFCVNYHGYCVLNPCHDIYVYVYLYCCEGFCGKRRYNVSLCLLWIAVLNAPTNVQSFCYRCKHICVVAIWHTVGCIWMFLIWCGIVMLYGIMLVEMTTLNEIALISTLITSAAFNGLNVTMAYCVRFGFLV